MVAVTATVTFTVLVMVAVTVAVTIAVTGTIPVYFSSRDDYSYNFSYNCGNRYSYSFGNSEGSG